MKNKTIHGYKVIDTYTKEVYVDNIVTYQEACSIKSDTMREFPSSSPDIVSTTWVHVYE